MSNYNTQLQSNNTDLQGVLQSLQNKAAGGDPVLQDKTVAPSTSAQTITADSGYDGLDTVTVSAMPTATQATPSITVNASGLITASATQTAGYVVAGTKSATKQLTTKAAATYTPTTTNQTIAGGQYLTGVQTIKGDANLVASNIKSGVSIFGVSGNYEGSGGGSSSGGGEGTCDFTVTLTSTSTINSYASICYLDANNTPTVFVLTSIMEPSPVSSTVSVRKNSLVTIIFPNGTINNLSGTAISSTGDCVVASSGIAGAALFSCGIPVLVNDTSSISLPLS